MYLDQKRIIGKRTRYCKELLVKEEVAINLYQNNAEDNKSNRQMEKLQSMRNIKSIPQNQEI